MFNATCALILTHGAGSNAEAPLLVSLDALFSAQGVLVRRYTLPFRRLRPHGPPHPADAAHDREGLAEAVAALRGEFEGPVFLGGHSYGGRQAAMLAADHPETADGLLLLSYPLHPPRKPAERRTAHFPRLKTPALFLHGSRDPFGSLAEMREAIQMIPARTDLIPIEGAGHDLKSRQSLASAPAEFQRFFDLPARS